METLAIIVSCCDRKFTAAQCETHRKPLKIIHHWHMSTKGSTKNSYYAVCQFFHNLSACSHRIESVANQYQFPKLNISPNVWFLLFSNFWKHHLQVYTFNIRANKQVPTCSLFCNLINLYTTYNKYVKKSRHTYHQRS